MSRNADKCLLTALIVSLFCFFPFIRLYLAQSYYKSSQSFKAAENGMISGEVGYAVFNTCTDYTLMLLCLHNLALFSLTCIQNTIFIFFNKTNFIWPANKNQLDQWSSLVSYHESKCEKKLGLKKLRLRRDSKPYSQILVGHKRLKYVASEAHFRGFFFRV